mmetsp:Transcript_38583/g.91455  ORF Transcript_38583/g.91455 Transcript_38583/m.91455 type:complete len:516 (+) Transcript_38583:997-2544(+)
MEGNPASAKVLLRDGGLSAGSFSSTLILFFRRGGPPDESSVAGAAHTAWSPFGGFPMADCSICSDPAIRLVTPAARNSDSFARAAFLAAMLALALSGFPARRTRWMLGSSSSGTSADADPTWLFVRLSSSSSGNGRASVHAGSLEMTLSCTDSARSDGSLCRANRAPPRRPLQARHSSSRAVNPETTPGREGMEFPVRSSFLRAGSSLRGSRASPASSRLNDRSSSCKLSKVPAASSRRPRPLADSRRYRRAGSPARAPIPGSKLSLASASLSIEKCGRSASSTAWIDLPDRHTVSTSSGNSAHAASRIMNPSRTAEEGSTGTSNRGLATTTGCCPAAWPSRRASARGGLCRRAGPLDLALRSCPMVGFGGGGGLRVCLLTPAGPYSDISASVICLMPLGRPELSSSPPSCLYTPFRDSSELSTEICEGSSEGALGEPLRSREASSLRFRSRTRSAVCSAPGRAFEGVKWRGDGLILAETVESSSASCGVLGLEEERRSRDGDLAPNPAGGGRPG